MSSFLKEGDHEVVEDLQSKHKIKMKALSCFHKSSVCFAASSFSKGAQNEVKQYKKTDHVDQFPIPVLEKTTTESIVSIIVVSIPFILIEVCIITANQPNMRSIANIVEFLIIRIPITGKHKDSH